MARGFISVTNEGKTALTSAVAQTVSQVVSPANQMVAVRSAYASFDASANAQPVEVLLVLQTGAGTSSAATPQKDGIGAWTVQSTARKTFTVEPASDDSVLRRYLVHPQTGFERVFGGPGDEIIIEAGKRLGMKINAPAGVNVEAGFTLEE